MRNSLPSAARPVHRGRPSAAAVSFTLVALLGALALLAAPAARAQGLTAVWANDGGDKVTRDELRASGHPGAVLNSVWDGSRIRLFGGRNEVVAFNLVLEAGEGAAEGVTVTFDTLTGPGGAAITSRAASGDGVFNFTGRPIELFYVRYLAIRGLSVLSYETYDERHIPRRLRRSWRDDGRGYGTWDDRPDHDKEYPDIAVPLELVGAFDVPAGRNQSIWVDVYIPKGTPPGLYQGTLTVRQGPAVRHRLPVELTVRGFTLPDVPAAETMVYFGDEDINRRYTGVRWPECGSPEAQRMETVRDRHFLLAHRHRVSLIDSDPGACSWDEDRPRPAWVPRLDGSLFTAAHGYAGPGVGTGNNVYSIGTYGSWGWQGEGAEAMRRHADAWEGWFAAHAPGTERFLYLADESDDYPEIQRWAEWIETSPGPGRDLLSMATLPAPEARRHAPSLDVAASGSNVGKTREWQTAVDAYRAAPDKRFFVYNGTRPVSGSFATEDDGVALRMLGWAQHKKGIDRWFFWESTYYNNFQADEGQTNVFRQAHTFGAHSRFDSVLGETGWNYNNGDGVLFYPGTDRVFPGESYGVAGPFASLRLKHWRRGIQDADYLQMAAAVDPAAVEAIVDQQVPTVLWEYGVDDPDDPTWVRTDIRWSTDPDDWEAARLALADLLDPPGGGGPTGPCVADDTTLCLGDGRFRITVRWETRQVAAGPGHARPLTADSGTFWFFNEDDVELIVKVVDACGLATPRFWVFAAGLTNVHTLLTVEDTATGQTRTYTNPQGTPFQPVQDTDAFATCP